MMDFLQTVLRDNRRLKNGLGHGQIDRGFAAPLLVTLQI
jgi:hypothetical protein